MEPPHADSPPVVPVPNDTKTDSVALPLAGLGSGAGTSTNAQGTPVPTVENILTGLDRVSNAGTTTARWLFSLGSVIVIGTLAFLVHKLNGLSAESDELSKQCMAVLRDAKDKVAADTLLACSLGPRFGRNLPYVFAALAPLALGASLVSAGLRSLRTAQRLGAILQTGILSQAMPNSKEHYLLLSAALLDDRPKDKKSVLELIADMRSTTSPSSNKEGS